MLLRWVNRTSVLLAAGVAAVGLATLPLGQTHEVRATPQRLAGATADLAHHIRSALQCLLQETSNAGHLST